MLEARVKQASVLKKLLDGESYWRNLEETTSGRDRWILLTLAIKELVSDGNLDCTDEGIVSTLARYVIPMSSTRVHTI